MNPQLCQHWSSHKRR